MKATVKKKRPQNVMNPESWTKNFRGFIMRKKQAKKCIFATATDAQPMASECLECKAIE